MQYFLGTDVGGTKTHTAICDQNGQVVGVGKSGPGNPQNVGFDGLRATLQSGLKQALGRAGISAGQISAAGFGIAGYDWPSALPQMEQVIQTLGLGGPFQVVNDTIPGLVAGARDGWGISVVSGTGCNCRGRDRSHEREGRVTGYGETMGEAGGASEMVIHAIQVVSQSWTQRLPYTALSQAFVQLTNAANLDDFIEGYTLGRYEIDASAAPLVLDVARSGDPLAIQVVEWTGRELGEMVKGVVRQLEFENLDFDVVMVGGMFANGKMLIDNMRQTIHGLAPGAKLVHLNAPPVMGALIIGMEQGGVSVNEPIRQRLAESLRQALT